MRTILDINEEAEGIKTSITALRARILVSPIEKRQNKAAIKRHEQRLQFLSRAKIYLSMNPRREYLLKEADRLKHLVERVDSDFAIYYPNVKDKKILAEFRKERDYQKNKKLLGNIRFLLA